MIRYQGVFVFLAITLVVILIRSPHEHAPRFLQPATTLAATTWHTGKVTIRSIRKVENVRALKGKAGIEIELENTERFHIGDLDWSLQIGDLKLSRPIRRSADHHSLTYVVGVDEWNKLKEGAPLYLTWGQYDARAKEVEPFGSLKKELLQ